MEAGSTETSVASCKFCHEPKTVLKNVFSKVRDFLSLLKVISMYIHHTLHSMLSSFLSHCISPQIPANHTFFSGYFIAKFF